LVSKLSKQCNLDNLIDAGKKLAKSEDLYLANAGLTIMGDPKVLKRNLIRAIHFAGKPTKHFPVAFEPYADFFPSKERIKNMKIRSAESYNFIRFIERFLRLAVALNKIEFVKDKESYERMLDMMIWLSCEDRSFGEEHRKYLKKVCDAPDLEGTLVKK